MSGRGRKHKFKPQSNNLERYSRAMSKELHSNNPGNRPRETRSRAALEKQQRTEDDSVTKIVNMEQQKDHGTHDASMVQSILGAGIGNPGPAQELNEKTLEQILQENNLSEEAQINRGWEQPPGQMQETDSENNENGNNENGAKDNENGDGVEEKDNQSITTSAAETDAYGTEWDGLTAEHQAERVSTIYQEIEIAHPIGARGNQLIARFYSRPYRNRILQRARQKLPRGENSLRITEDMTRMDYETRKRAIPRMNRAYKKGQRCSFRNGKLIINGQVVYMEDIDSDTDGELE